MRAARPALAVLFVAALASVALWRSGPPAPRGAEAPAGDFSSARADEVLRRLVEDETPRPPGSPGHGRFRERLLAELSRLGLVPRVESGFACAPHGSCAFLTNVVAELPGTAAGPAVLLVAHYDSVEAGPGVADDAASVACLLEAARALLTSPRRSPVLLLFDDGEEAGLLGAELFAASGGAKKAGVVVNAEARGTSGASFLFETGRDNAWLVRRAAARMPRPVTSSVHSFVYDRLPNDTDLTVFKREGLAGLNLAFLGSAARYHTREDSLANLSRASLQHQGENVLALARALAGEDLSSPPAGDAVFFDLLGVTVLWWPVEASPALALLALALVRAGSVRRGGRLLPRPSALVPFLSVLAGPAAAALTWQLLRLAGAFPYGFVAHPWAATLAAVAAALAATLPPLALESRWTGSPSDGWERIWTSTALLGLVLAAALPEVSFLAIAPALAAGLCRLTLPERVAAVLPAALFGALLLPLGLRMPEALGPAGLPLAGAAAAFVLCALPLATAPGAARPVSLTLAGVWGAATAAALLVPVATPDSPEHGSMVVAEEEGAARARLLYRPASRRLTGAVAAAAPFASTAEVLPWGRRGRAFATPLASLGLPFPTLDVLEDAGGADGARRLLVRLRSERGASSVGLSLTGTGAVVRVNGQPLSPSYLRRPGGRASRVFCRAAPPDGIVVELALPAGQAEAFVFDQSPGLPPGAEPIGRTRPAHVAPSDGGDATVLYRKARL